MKFEQLGITNSLLWFFIAIFLFFWLGEQLLGAVTHLEIESLRVTNLVSFDSRPIWFISVTLHQEKLAVQGLAAGTVRQLTRQCRPLRNLLTNNFLVGPSSGL